MVFFAILIDVVLALFVIAMSVDFARSFVSHDIFVYPQGVLGKIL